MELLYFAVVLLFISSGAPANAQNSGKETVMSVAAGGPLTVECPLRVEARAEWRLNGSAVPADMTPGERAAPGGRLTARLHAAAARPHHAGVYTCSRDRDAHRVRLVLAPAAALSAAAEPAAQLTPPPQPAAVADEEDGEPIVVYDINRNLTLDCAMPSADKTLSYVWKKNDVVLEQVAELKGRFKLDEGGAVFSLVGRANEEDYGNYSCALGADERAWRVHGRPVVRLPDNTNVVEGQKIKLQCKVIGKPYPAVTWSYNTSLEANESVALTEGSRDGRVRLEPNEQGVAGAALVLEAAARADAGLYTCRASHSADATQLRVKDMYAALWPFLGICAEVFVLCAIILVYEKRRTKPELEDSDTDNHDQKKS